MEPVKLFGTYTDGSGHKTLIPINIDANGNIGIIDADLISQLTDFTNRNDVWLNDLTIAAGQTAVIASGHST